MMVMLTMQTTKRGTVTPAQFKTTREHLGFTLDEIAAYLGNLAPRTVRNWEQGRYEINAGAAGELRELVEFTHSYIESLSENPTRTLTTYRSDSEFHRAHPGMSRYPARWHRHVTAAVAYRTGAEVVF